MIAIIAKCYVHPEAVDPFLTLVHELVTASRAESGNISYDFYRDLQTPVNFTFIECWKDQEAIDTHNASVHFKNFGEQTALYFAAPLEISLYEKLL
ncbi:MAG: antibiotic biosynthesis monooxygenase [Methanocalculaceae archaeon]|jgi:quinol monooxygenase YgiN|nr:antibiotic biosynthesis monooxygenase [Methanocalculaceae archaeon]